MHSVNRVYRRAQLFFGIGRTQAEPSDTGSVQTVQVRMQPDNAVRDASKVMQLYGFSSSAPIGTDVLMLFVAGDRSNGVVIATGNQQARRRGLGSGEVSMHALGMDIHLSVAGLVIDAGGLPVTVKNGTKARFEMPIESTGEITAMTDGNSVALSTHQTLSVQSGGGTSGPPKPHT